MVWLKIVLQIVSIAVAYQVARLDYVTHDKRTRSFKAGLFGLWVLLILMVVGNIFVILNDEQESDKIKIQLGDLKNELGNTKKAVTGGDNFPFVMISMGKDSGRLSVHNPGDSPLYDVSFRMWDPGDYEAPNKLSRSFDEFLAKSIIREVGNLTPRGARILDQ